MEWQHYNGFEFKAKWSVLTDEMAVIIQKLYCYVKRYPAITYD